MVCALLPLTCLPACSLSSDVLLPKSLSTFDDRETVIVLHGYYGSGLKEKEGGTRRWLKLSTILAGNFRVALDSAKLEVLESPELEVEGMMGRFTVLPGIYSTDVYGNFIEKLEESGRYQTVSFAYDWRKDLFSAVVELDALVNSLQARGVRRISLASHSMGGLVAAYYLAYGAAPPEKATLNWAGAKSVERAGFFGTPFGGVMSILRNMQQGTGYPWNKKMLQAGTVASFPSSYHLLPLDGAHFKTAAGQDISVNLGDPEFWEKHKLGLYREAPPSAYSARKEYTKTQLGRAERFQKLVRAATNPPSSLRLFNVTGRGRPTLNSGYFNPENGELLFSPDEVKAKGLPSSLLESDGDGTVPTSQAMVPAGMMAVTTHLESEFSHDRLFADPLMEKAFETFLGKQPEQKQ